MYYDRGELFSYLSPGVTGNITTGGPFGINAQEPFVNSQSCLVTIACTPSLENPYGTTLVQPTGKANSIVLPNACALATLAGDAAPNAGSNSASNAAGYDRSDARDSLHRRRAR